MEINISNFCLVKEAKLKLDSIAVIGAENDTGKSTIGKILFGLFYSNKEYLQHYLRIAENELKVNFNKISIDKKVKIRNSYLLDLKKMIDELKDPEFEENEESLLYGESTRNDSKKIKIISDFKESIHKNIERYLLNNDILNKKYINEFKSNYLIKGKNTFTAKEKETILSAIKDIEILLKTLESKETLLAIYTNFIFNSEFSKNLKNFKSENPKTMVEIKDKLYNMSIVFENNYVKEYTTTNINNIKDVIYIETPLFLDAKDTAENRFRKVLRNKLQKKEIILETPEKIEVKENILKQINSIILGKMYYDESEQKYKFKRSNEELPMKAVASGIKSFGIISLLLENNHLTKDSILIIDEPEVHLHPKWQIKYAEILCVLVKEIGLKLLVNSHSPYFIEAMSVYTTSNKYQLEKSTKFYSYSIYEDGNILIDKTNDLAYIYNKLAEPYDILNKEKYNQELEL